MSKSEPRKKETFVICVLDEANVEILALRATTDGKETHVRFTPHPREVGPVWTNVSTALGACAFWLWKQIFRDQIFPTLADGKEDEELPF